MTRTNDDMTACLKADMARQLYTVSAPDADGLCTVSYSSTTKYAITTGPDHYDGQRPWMAHASMVDFQSIGSRCHLVAATSTPTLLERALDADDDVIEYEDITL